MEVFIVSIPITDKLHWVDKDKTMLKYWCPGCKEIHMVFISPSKYPHPVWKWNGDVNSLTIEPSVKHSDAKKTLCHYFIRNGQFYYCSDSIHELKGKVVDMEPIPKEY